MPPAGFKKRTKDQNDPNDPDHWELLGKITDDSGATFESFEGTSREQLEVYEALGWKAVPDQAQIIRKEIGIWTGNLAYAYSTLARARTYESKAKAVVKYTLKKRFPNFATVDQTEACAARIVGYRHRWEAVRDSLEQKVMVGKKLLNDEDREKKIPS